MTWDGSAYVATWTPPANALLGTWNAKVTAVDPEGSAGVGNKTFSVVNSPPDIGDATAPDVPVNGSSVISVPVTDYETPAQDLSVYIRVLKSGTSAIVAEGYASYESACDCFRWAFVPTEAGVYDVNVTAKDGDLGMSSRLFKGLIAAFSESEAAPTTTPPPETVEESMNLPSFDLVAKIEALFAKIPGLGQIANTFGAVNTLLTTIVLSASAAAILQNAKNRRASRKSKRRRR